VSKATRSGCPINLSLEVFGDRWTLIVLRDMIFSGARHFRELLNNQEGISSNILADRLEMLVEQGLLTKAGDPTHKQKVIYSLTEPAIELVPVLVHLGDWGTRNLSPDAELAARARALVAGGPAMWDAYMDELREAHLGPGARLHPAPEGPTVSEQLERAVNGARS
jgi:DNA-binding HxlR family transcriptional regulator